MGQDQEQDPHQDEGGATDDEGGPGAGRPEQQPGAPDAGRGGADHERDPAGDGASSSRALDGAQHRRTRLAPRLGLGVRRLPGDDPVREAVQHGPLLVRERAEANQELAGTRVVEPSLGEPGTRRLEVMARGRELAVQASKLRR